MTRIRQKELNTRRMRAKKLQMLRTRYAAAGSSTLKQQVLEKLTKIAPWMTEKEFLGKAGK